jgi:hypothetical protein
MKTTNAKIIIALLIFASGLLITTTANAQQTIVSQLEDNQNLGQGGDGTTNEARGFLFYLPVEATVTEMVLKSAITQDNTSPNSMTYYLIGADEVKYLDQTETNLSASADTEYSIEFDNPIELPQGYYFFGTHYNSGTGVTKGYQSPSTEEVNGCGYENFDVVNFEGNFDFTDCYNFEANTLVYFRLIGTTNILTWIYPTDELQTAPFSHYVVRANFFEDVEWPTIYIGVSDNAGIDLASSTTHEWFLSQAFVGNQSAGSVGAFSLANVIDDYVSSTTYYAKAKVYDLANPGGNFDFETEEIEFTFGNVDSAPFDTGLFASGAFDEQASSTLSLPSLPGLQIEFCEGSFISPRLWTCHVFNGIKTLLNFLFVPSSESIFYFSEAYEEMQTLFPLSLFFGIRNAVEDGVEAISAGEDLDFDLVIDGETKATFTAWSATAFEDIGLSDSQVAEFWNVILMVLISLWAFMILSWIYHYLL